MPSLRWYRQRLWAMAPAELPWRAWRIARGKIGRWRAWPAAKELRLEDVWEGECSAEWLRSRKIGFPPLPDRETLTELPNDWRQRTLEEAEDLVAHRLSLFALEREDFGAEIDWNRDYSSSLRVPLRYAPDLDYRDPGQVGDVKYVWELGRMQHLTRLGQAWRLSGDERFPREIVEQISSWIEQCPYMQGIHWASPMEAAVRLITWTWAVHLITDWTSLPDEFLHQLVRSIHQHVAFIDCNYSRFSSANNHLIAEATGAYFAAGYWSPLKEADRWRRRAKRRLARECIRQNHADGVNKEQAFGYQVFVWDLFLIAALMGRAGGDEFSQDYWQQLKQMAEFIDCVSDVRGHTPNIGDRDDGIAVDLGQYREHPALAVRATAASLWPETELHSTPPAQEEPAACWFTTPRAGPLESVTPAMPQPVPGYPNRYFPGGGYYVFRDGAWEREALLLFDVGPLGWPRTAVHGHADALSVVFHLAGRPVLIDPGTFSYQDSERRRRDRSTGWHNTLCFGEHDQAEYVNRFIWGKRPRVRIHLTEHVNGPVVVQAELQWWSGAFHGRRIEWHSTANKFTIADTWAGPQPPIIGFCLASGLQPEINQNTVVVDTDEFEIRLRNQTLKPERSDISVAPKCYHNALAPRVVFSPPDCSGYTVTDISWKFRH